MRTDQVEVRIAKRCKLTPSLPNESTLLERYKQLVGAGLALISTDRNCKRPKPESRTVAMLMRTSAAWKSEYRNRAKDSNYQHFQFLRDVVVCSLAGNFSSISFGAPRAARAILENKQAVEKLMESYGEVLCFVCGREALCRLFMGRVTQIQGCGFVEESLDMASLLRQIFYNHHGLPDQEMKLLKKRQICIDAEFLMRNTIKTKGPVIIASPMQFRHNIELELQKRFHNGGTQLLTKAQEMASRLYYCESCKRVANHVSSQVGGYGDVVLEVGTWPPSFLCSRCTSRLVFYDLRHSFVRPSPNHSFYCLTPCCASVGLLVDLKSDNSFPTLLCSSCSPSL